MQTSIRLYGQSVSIETRDHGLAKHLERFIELYYAHIPLQASANVEVKPKIYASKITGYPVWFLHANQFTHFRFYLRDNRYELKDYELEDLRDYPTQGGDYKVRDNWQLREGQVGVNEFLLDNPKGSKLLPLATGSGKAQPLSSLVKIPGGWTTMRDIQVGDVITAWDGKPTTVTGVFPQGVTPTYSLLFEDRRETIVSSEHLWRVYAKEGSEISEPRVITTIEMSQLKKNGADLYIDLIKPEEEDDFSLDKMDDIINDAEKSWTFDVNHYWLNTNTAVRKHLLQELVYKKAKRWPSVYADSLCYFDPNEGRIKNYQLLARSLGYKAAMNGGPYGFYLVIEKIEDCDIPLLKIESIEPKGKEETQCISIDHPDRLYVTNDYIVTHNTLCGLYSVGKLNTRLGIIVLSQFCEKWISDIVEIHEAEETDVVYVQGSASIRSLIEHAKENQFLGKYYVFSSRTVQDYVSAYEKDPVACVDSYGAAPIDLFPLLGIGILLIDETHMAFHAMYKTVLHMNVKYQIGLSATLIADSAATARAHLVMYPKACTYHDNMQKKYMDIYAVSYAINPTLVQKRLIRSTHNGSKFYAHTAFEKSILKNKKYLDEYYQLIKSVMEDYYIEGRDPRDSLIIYVATISMATAIKEMLQRDYPDKEIVRYVEDDDYEPMLKAEIVVTTPQSLSTGIDKKNLRVVIQTVSISSEVTTIQSAGRLRELPDRDVKYVYLFSPNINKQVEYHRKKEPLFLTRAKNFVQRRARKTING